MQKVGTNFFLVCLQKHFVSKMVQFCCIVGCGNRSNREYLRFYRLPALKKRTDITSAKAELILKRRRQWLENIARVDLKDGDSNYSPGYIRVCSDHFLTGEPSELTDVDHPDWAPTFKLGHGRIRMKGNLYKRKMLGFPLPEKKNIRKKQKNAGRGRRKPTTLTILVDDPDKSEIEQRKMLAIETDHAEKKKKYKPVKNPYAKRRKKPPPEIKRQQMEARRQQMRAFMHLAREQQNCKINVKHRPVDEKHIDNWFSSFMEDRPATSKQNAASDTEDTEYVSPLIHKITKDAVVVHDRDISLHLDASGESNFEMLPVDRCHEEPLYNRIKSKDDDESLDDNIKFKDHVDESLDNNIKFDCENDSLDNKIKFGEHVDESLNNNIKFDCENESLDNNIKFEYYEDESLNNSTQSEDDVKFVYPSADEEKLLQELMNGHLQDLKNEIKQELC